MSSDSKIVTEFGRQNKVPKVAICHEWFDNIGGGEKVLIQIASIFENPTIFTLWGDRNIQKDTNLNFKESFLRFFPKKFRRNLGLPFMPIAWFSFSRKLRRFDLVITSSWAFAHSCGRYNSNSLNYVHTPGRYWWNPDIDQRTAIKLPKLVLLTLKKIDFALSRNHGTNISNSKNTQERVQKFWNQNSKVVYPPVDLDFYNLDKKVDLPKGNYLLGVGRFVTYKKPGFIIELGEYLNMPVLIAGHGPLYSDLVEKAANAKVEVRIINNPTNEIIKECYRSAKYLIYPVVEDFGIVPVEAMGCGLQVIGLNSGGLTETIVEGLSGSLVSSVNVQEFASAIQHLPHKSRSEVRECALKFSEDAFIENFRNLMA